MEECEPLEKHSDKSWTSLNEKKYNSWYEKNKNISVPDWGDLIYFLNIGQTRQENNRNPTHQKSKKKTKSMERIVGDTRHSICPEIDGKNRNEYKKNTSNECRKNIHTYRLRWISYPPIFQTFFSDRRISPQTMRSWIPMRRNTVATIYAKISG